MVWGEEKEVVWEEWWSRVAVPTRRDRASGGSGKLCGTSREHVGVVPGPGAADLGEEAAETPKGLNVKLSQWPPHTEYFPCLPSPFFLHPVRLLGACMGLGRRNPTSKNK